MRCVAALLLLLSLPASAAAELEAGGSAAVAEVIDGDTVLLDAPVDGARQVRLVGLQAPKLPLGRPGFPAWPLAGDAKSALEMLLLGRRVTLRFGGARRDRHGRHLAHLVTAGGTWAQGEMLRQGMARVYSFPDNRARVAEMLAIEAAARQARRGIWDHPFYAVRVPETAERHVGTFELVEGRVVDAATVGGRTYLNFGDDWRTDFTVTIERKALRLFTGLGMDPLSLKGRTVRARGWIRRFNGAMIEASHPEQIEIPPPP